jgi:ubiquinone/menaquinone biosynthesis C-methylase UbiE
MSSEVTRFVGPIPELYEQHMGPALFEPYAKELARRIGGARRVLEVACGTGRVTRHLLAELPTNGELCATDLNEPMIAEAKRKVPAHPCLTWRAADVQALPFDPASFDAVVCQFGLMFVPDKLLALREMRRVLHVGGALLFNTWDAIERNAATAVLQELADKTCPDDPPQFFRDVPHSMHDVDELRALVHDAGFFQVRVETISQTAEAESAAHLAAGLVRGNPLRNQLAEREVDTEAFEARVAEALAATFGDRPCRSALSAHVVTARA